MAKKRSENPISKITSAAAESLQTGRLPVLTVSEIDRLKGLGYTQSEIAEMHGVTRQYVSWIKHTYGGRLTPREIILEHFPFQVPVDMGHTAPYRRLRDHGEFVATGGVGMTEDKLRRLRNWYRKLRENNWVVEFDPELPPEPGVSAYGGWAYREATPDELKKRLLIRVNEYTHITEKGKRIWRFPRSEP